MADVGAVTDRGRVREENEDRYLAKRARGVTLLAVADGVGGEAGGEVASAAAVDALASSFDFRARDTAGSLGSAMRAANDAVLRAAGEGGSPFAASTLVAAAVRGRQVAVANLGDSRAYIVSGRSVRQVTSDHAGEQANAITRFVGDPRGVAPDVFIETVRPGDRVLLCSDGLTRHVGPEDIARLARGAPERAARDLVALANERGGEDNVTVVLYGAPPSSAAMILVVVVAALGLVGALLSMGVPSVAPASPAPEITASPSPTPTASPTDTPSRSPTPP